MHTVHKDMFPLNLYGIIPSKLVLVLTGSASILAVLQAVTPVPDPVSFIGQMERLGLVGALIMAVIVLWRKLDTKDTTFSEASMKMVDALSLNNQLMKELKDSVCELKEAVDKSVTVRETVEDIRKNKRG